MSYRSNRKAVAGCIVLIILLIVGCAQYRVVKVYEVLPVDETQGKETYFAIAKNNVVIPEYVIDETGQYPRTQEEAWERFYARQARLEEVINEKYAVPNSVLYQCKRNIIMIGLIAVAPIVIPITYISECFQKPEERVYDKSLRKITKNYFSLSMNEPVRPEPALKDEFEIVNIYH